MPFKNLSNIWKTPRIFLINCEINLALAFSVNFVLCEGGRARGFAMADKNLYVPVVTL